MGRTGAGKSSVFAALFRLVELSRGAVYVDEVDVSKLSLKKLRCVRVCVCMYACMCVWIDPKPTCASMLYLSPGVCVCVCDLVIFEETLAKVNLSVSLSLSLSLSFFLYFNLSIPL